MGMFCLSLQCSTLAWRFPKTLLIDVLDQGVYKGVRAWSRRWLEKAGERVMDVQIDENDDDDEGDVDATTSSASQRNTKDQ